ncbi:BAH-domain-containing protein, partial [Neocallimastix californiae]
MENVSDVKKVKEGDIYYEINDTVYLAPENVNEAYYLGRIMEFVKDQNGSTTQAKIAWFLRPRDILGKKKNFDSRLLLATMHYDVNPISSIRGKCIIKHRSHIEDFESYRQQEDTFYYEKLYDRYSQRLYDVVPVEQIRNLSDTLVLAFYPYKFIIVDDGKAPDFVDKRECAVCGKWVDSDVLLDCLHCHRKFHMYCIDPPMTKKPSKGYAWECLECLGYLTENEDEEAGDEMDDSNLILKMNESRNHSTIINNNNNTKYSPKKSKKLSKISISKEEEKEPPLKRNLIPPNADEFEEPKWPFIYFGDISRRNTFLTDNLDPTDIFPKTCSRVGKKYQSDIPDLLSPEEIENQKKVNLDEEISNYDTALENEIQERIHNNHNHNHNNNNSKGKGRKKRGKIKEQDVPIALRGSKYELVYSKPDEWEDEKVNEYIKKVRDCHSEIKNMDLFDRALLELHKSNYDIDKSFSIMEKITLKDLDLPTWSKTEIKQFENGIIKYGHELQYVKQEVPTKRRKDVVQYFYRWKKSPRYRLIYSQFCKVHRPGKVFVDLEKDKALLEKEGIDIKKEIEDKDHKEASEIEKKTENKTKSEEDNYLSSSENRKHQHDKENHNHNHNQNQKPPEELFCTNCQIPIIPNENSGSQTMCEECLIYWLKYYTQRPLGDKKNKDNAKLKRKREEEKLKLKKRSSKKMKSQQSTNEHDGANTDDQSKIKMEDLPQTEEPEENLVPCSVCFNYIDTYWNPIIQCISCNLRVHKKCYGIADHDEVTNWQCSRCRNKDNQRSSMNYTCVLCNIKKNEDEDALKLTMSNNWAHVLCSLFIPEIK